MKFCLDLVYYSIMLPFSIHILGSTNFFPDTHKFGWKAIAVIIILRFLYDLLHKLRYLKSINKK